MGKAVLLYEVTFFSFFKSCDAVRCCTKTCMAEEKSCLAYVEMNE
jgi:hypothetical protein